jgi:prevent-host-death family protein
MTAFQPQQVVTERDLLQQGIQEVLPAALVKASPEAQELLRSSAVIKQPSQSVDATVVAAALGSIAVPSVTQMLSGWLDRNQTQREHTALPAWFKPKLDPDATLRVSSLTEFSQRRTQFVNAVEDGEVIILTRRGTAVAAVVPLEPGSYESSVTVPALQRLLAEATSAAELDADKAAEISSSDDPTAAAEALGIDTSGWDRLNPPSPDAAERDDPALA